MAKQNTRKARKRTGQERGASGQGINMLVPRTERHKLQVKQQCAPEIRERRVNDGMKQNESMQRKGLTHKSSNVRARERRRKVIL